MRFIAFIVTVCIPVMLAAGLADARPPNKGQLKMALVNIKSLYSDGPDAAVNQANIDANLKRHFYFIDKLAAAAVDFVGFPELSINGYRFSKTMTWLRLDGPEVKALQKKAIEKRIYISVGLAIQDADGKRWNVQIVIDPQGRIIAVHRKIYLTKEKDYVEAGTDHKVFDVKGIKMGIAICADGSDKANLQKLTANGAQLIYGPHANTTGGTTAGWYKFRASWAGPKGWIAELKVHAALHNHAGLYHPDFDPPAATGTNTGWASGAWFIGPDGATLVQMPASTQKADSRENVLIYSVTIP
ncbi:MAG: carbon-nitrogen hydrolase family protein [Planctomycetes bacterium]|nr:carbon-nitrogen hydrolase family protein [Planctomycetota bacterium]